MCMFQRASTFGKSASFYILHDRAAVSAVAKNAIATSHVLPTYGAETVDAMTAFAKVFDQLNSSAWTDETQIGSKLRDVSFAGVSGKVSFDSQGDREGSRFTLLNYVGAQNQSVDVGSVGVHEGSLHVSGSVCWNGDFGCTRVPPDKYQLANA